VPERRRLRIIRVSWPWLGWFGDVLPAPPEGWRCNARFWFRTHEGAELLRLAARFALDLATLGYDIRLRRSDAPGRITFEDRFQVAALDRAGPRAEPTPREIAASQADRLELRRLTTLG
jgi:hypothetical protein